MSAQQQQIETVHIGSVMPALLQIAPVGARLILDAYKTAYLSRYVTRKGRLYQITHIQIDAVSGKIVARFEAQD